MIETRPNDEAGKVWLAAETAAGSYMLVNEKVIRKLTGEHAPQPAEVPTILSARKFWLAAIDLGYKARIDAMVAQMSERDQIIVSKEDEFDRTNPLFAGFATALGVTDAEVLAFFTYGASLP